MEMTKLQSRLAAVCLLLVVTAALGWVLCFPLVSLYLSQAGAIQQKEQQIDRYQYLASNQAALENELASLRRRSPAASYYVAGETQALASARMQQYLKQIVERNGSELISTQIVDKAGTENDRSSRLKVHLRSEMGEAAKILYLLESGRPLLFIDDLVISARRVRSTSGGATPSVSLDLNFELTGYLQEGV